MNQKEILHVLKAFKPNLQQKYPLQKLGVFGSVARGDLTDTSDVDIVVVTEYADLFDLIGIKQDIEEIIHRKVDIVRIRKKMNQFLKKRIERDVIYV